MEPLVFLLLLLPVQAILAQPVWNLSIGDFVRSLDISSDGSYAVASSLHVEAGVGRICLFDKNGTIVWDYLANFPISTAISASGKHIVVGVRSEGIFYLSREGELIWSYRAGDLYFDVQISIDGNSVAVSTSSGNVYYFNGKGKKLWSYRFSSWFIPVSMSSDGSLVAVGGSYEVMLLSRLGEILWSSEVDCEVRKISISPDGTYIMATSDHKIYFLDNRGEILWSSEVEGEVFSIAFSSDGNSVAVTSILKEGSENKGVVSFYNSYGELLWSYDIGSWAVVSISSDGNYVVVGGEGLHVLDRSGELLLNLSVGEAPIHVISLSTDANSVVIGTGGNLIFISLEEILRQHPPKKEAKPTALEKFFASVSLIITLSLIGTLFLILERKIRSERSCKILCRNLSSWSSSFTTG